MGLGRCGGAGLGVWGPRMDVKVGVLDLRDGGMILFCCVLWNMCFERIRGGVLSLRVFSRTWSS